MHPLKILATTVVAISMAACERPTKSTSAKQPDPESDPAPLAVSASALPLPLPTPPPASEDPFQKLDAAKPEASPPIDPNEVQKEALRRARELRAEANRMRETL